MSIGHRLEGKPPVLRDGRWKYYRGPLGVGVYTVDHIDVEGNYGVYFFKRVPGSRKLGTSLSFVRVESKDTTRKSKSKAIDRAYKLAHGKDRYHSAPVEQMAEDLHAAREVTAQTNAYCVKQRKKVFVPAWTQSRHKGRSIIFAACPECGTRIQRYGRLIDCPECGQTREARTDDYVCRVCRDNM